LTASQPTNTMMGAWRSDPAKIPGVLRLFFPQELQECSGMVLIVPADDGFRIATAGALDDELLSRAEPIDLDDVPAEVQGWLDQLTPEQLASMTGFTASRVRETFMMMNQTGNSGMLIIIKPIPIAID
jgi:hypothetical protein